jgi:hypothetical protein
MSLPVLCTASPRGARIVSLSAAWLSAGPGDARHGAVWTSSSSAITSVSAMDNIRTSLYLTTSWTFMRRDYYPGIYYMKCSDYDIILLVIASRGGCACGDCGCCRGGHKDTTEYDDFVRVYWSRFIRYLRDRRQRIKVFMVYGNESATGLPLLREDVLQYEDAEDGLGRGITRKTVLSLAHVLDRYEFRHVIRTNLSSFFVLHSLIAISRRLPDERVYAGVELTDYRDNSYISGAGIWLSRDVADRLVRDDRLLGMNEPDDLAIGISVKDIPRRRLSCLFVTKPKKCSTIDYVDNCRGNRTLYMGAQSQWVEFSGTRGLLEKIGAECSYHIRLKSAADRGSDVTVAAQLATHFYPDTVRRSPVKDLAQDPEFSSLYMASR